MKLLIVGSNSEYAIERFYVKHLAESKAIAALDFFPAQQLFLDFYNKSMLHKILYRMGWSRVLMHINRKLKKHVSAFKPDLMLVFKGMEIFPETLQFFRQQGIKLVNFNPDNPFVFTGRGSGNKNITDSIGIYDAFISYDKGICKTMELNHKVKSFCIPFGYEANNDDADEQIDEILRVCFIGNGDGKRMAFLNQLAEKGLNIDLYGSLWKSDKLHHNINLFSPIFGNDFIQCIKKYRLQLNLMRIHNPDSHNMRSFEIPGYGGLQLAPKTEDHAVYFRENEQIFLYSDLNDCFDKANHILQLDRLQALSLRNKAKMACVQNGYSYQSRTSQLVESLKQVMYV